uniref:Uncharacterized protein n=1 Tax=Aegilops tauschii subsp. strangulata TaxID=200361 RepID=A0A453J4M2_AEGTS
SRHFSRPNKDASIKAHSINPQSKWALHSISGASSSSGRGLFPVVAGESSLPHHSRPPLAWPQSFPTATRGRGPSPALSPAISIPQ